MWASPPGRVPAHNAAPGSAWGGSRAGLLAEERPHLQGKSGSSSHLSVHPDGRGGQRLTCPLLCTSWSWTPSTPTRPVDSVETSTVTLSSTSLSPTVSPTCPPPSALAPPIALPARLSSRVPSQMAPPGGHGCTHTQACTGVRFQHADMHTRIVPARTCTHSPGHLQSQTSSRLDPATASWPWSPPPSPGPV